MITEMFDVEANGIVLLDPRAPYETLGWTPVPGEERDLMSEFFSSDLGDRVIKEGGVVPLLSIDDGGYELICRLEGERSTVEELVVVRNGTFPLVVKENACFYDLETLMHWPPRDAGVESGLKPGIYSVAVNGFRAVHSGKINRAGYEFVCEPADGVMEPTTEIDAYMRVFF